MNTHNDRYRRIARQFLRIFPWIFMVCLVYLLRTYHPTLNTVPAPGKSISHSTSPLIAGKTQLQQMQFDIRYVLAELHRELLPNEKAVKTHLSGVEYLLRKSHADLKAVELAPEFDPRVRLKIVARHLAQGGDAILAIQNATSELEDYSRDLRRVTGVDPHFFGHGNLTQEMRRDIQGAIQQFVTATNSDNLPKQVTEYSASIEAKCDEICDQERAAAYFIFPSYSEFVAVDDTATKAALVEFELALARASQFIDAVSKVAPEHRKAHINEVLWSMTRRQNTLIALKRRDIDTVQRLVTEAIERSMLDKLGKDNGMSASTATWPVWQLAI